MKLIGELIFILSIVLLISSCHKESKDFIGIFVATNTLEENGRIDTLIIKVDGTYQHLLYVKARNCKIYENKGKWEYDKHYLRFSNFRNNFFNPDCKCNQLKDCYTPDNTSFSFNNIGNINFLQEEVNILAGIKYKRIAAN